MVSFFRHLLIPHHSNNHRAKILHHKIISIFIISLLTILFTLNSLQRQYPSVLGVSNNITIEKLLELTNKERIKAGIAPLKLSQELNSAASSKASYMFEKNFWAHVAPDGTTPWYFIRNSGYEYQYAGENLARGFNASEDVVRAWMESPTHRDNLLSPNYTDIGFAVSAGNLTGTETILVVQEFGSRYIANGNSNETQLLTSVESINDRGLETNNAANEVNESQNISDVASAVNNPLIDTKSTTYGLSIYIIMFFILILLIDLIIIERKKISRVISHNLDHIVYFLFILLAVIIISGGIIL